MLDVGVDQFFDHVGLLDDFWAVHQRVVAPLVMTLL
tara:strand:+ start:398 stop:505 length:108 start_codon:yes stop_codon:yes gene_type:complete